LEAHENTHSNGKNKIREKQRHLFKAAFEERGNRRGKTNLDNYSSQKKVKGRRKAIQGEANTRGWTQSRQGNSFKEPAKKRSTSAGPAKSECRNEEEDNGQDAEGGSKKTRGQEYNILPKKKIGPKVPRKKKRRSKKGRSVLGASVVGKNCLSYRGSVETPENQYGVGRETRGAPGEHNLKGRMLSSWRYFLHTSRAQTQGVATRNGLILREKRWVNTGGGMESLTIVRGLPPAWMSRDKNGGHWEIGRTGQRGWRVGRSTRIECKWSVASIGRLDGVVRTRGTRLSRPNTFGPGELCPEKRSCHSQVNKGGLLSIAHQY